MFDPSELPATPPAKPPKDPQVFLVGSGTIADDQVNSQPVVSLIHNMLMATCIQRPPVLKGHSVIRRIL